jgi:hypothetical protein
LVKALYLNESTWRYIAEGYCFLYIRRRENPKSHAEMFIPCRFKNANMAVHLPDTSAMCSREFHTQGTSCSQIFLVLDNDSFHKLDAA